MIKPPPDAEIAETIPPHPRKGRGAVGNPAGRFAAESREVFDDGWEGDPDDALPPLRTTLTADAARTVITRNDSPDVPFDRSINVYRGCEHGCVYCFARPTHAYLGLSPGLDFETRLFVKRNAPELLDKELRAPGYAPRPVALGANTDPYQPVERRLGLTRRVLEVLRDFRHPLSVVTKSALILRDIDILAPMARDRLAHVCVSVTTLDRALARRMEPRAAAPEKRLETIRRLTEAGIPVTALVSPMIPGLNDHEAERILEAVAEAGATSAAYILVRLPLELKELFEEWLRAHFPDRADHVLSLIRECRMGRLNQARFGTRMRGTGTYADLLSDRFRLACRRLGLDARGFDLDCSAFRPPPGQNEQLRLF